MPVVSATTQRRLEGYFRREWSYALDRARNMAEGALFILPVSLDATSAAEARVPEKFKALHFTELPRGASPREFAQRLADLHAEFTIRHERHGSRASVDAHNPWLGLASFTEATRAFFFGREEEVAELERRVKRKLLTVLFGKSGLGKTSILRRDWCRACVRGATSRSICASTMGGTAPKLRSRSSRRLAERRQSGEWTQTGVAAAGESIWEFLHHRDAC